MILRTTFLLVLCFSLSTFNNFKPVSAASSSKSNSSSSSTPSNEEVDKYYSTMTKAQFLEKVMTLEELKKEYGPENLKDLKVYNETTPAGALPPVCGKNCPQPPPLPDRDIQFFLYTSEKPTLSQKLIAFSDAPALWKNVTLVKGADTIIICHGFMSGTASGPGEKLKAEYFKYYKFLNRPVNIILLDWAPAARVWQKHNLDSIRRVYFPPAVYVYGVGYNTKLLIRKLMSRGGIKLDQFHLIGHSLGAQAMGYAGKILAKDSDMKLERQVGRITALDPAAPCFEKGSWLHSFCIDRPDGYEPISKNDAKFVDVIHSNTAVFGMTDPVGHVDFYPNGGRFQPGCWYSPVCSHSRSIDLMAASINEDKRSYRAAICPSKTDAQKSACKSTKDAKFNFLGQFVSKEPANHGVYYLPTLAKPPYSSKF